MGEPLESVEASVRQADPVVRPPFPGEKVHGPGHGEVAVLREVGPLDDVHAPEGFRDQEMEIQVSLAVNLRGFVQRNAVEIAGKVLSVLRVEAPQEDLMGLASAGVLIDKDAGHDPEKVGGGLPGQVEEILVNDHLVRRGGHGFLLHDLKRLDFVGLVLVRGVRTGRDGEGQKSYEDEEVGEDSLHGSVHQEESPKQGYGGRCSHHP